VEAIARLGDVGWRLAVRADFDAAGLSHVTAILDKAKGAVPWRMEADDYRESVRDLGADEEKLERFLDTPWDPQLAVAMREKGVATHEECLLPALLEDMNRGSPGKRGR
jgi:hypothetical protein